MLNIYCDQWQILCLDKAKVFFREKIFVLDFSLAFKFASLFLFRLHVSLKSCLDRDL